MAAGYVAGAAALSIGNLIEDQLTSFPDFQAILSSIGAFLFVIVLAPSALIYLSFLLLPAFLIAVMVGFVFCRYDVRKRWFATAIGLIAGIAILPLGDVLLIGELDIGRYGSWHSSLDMIVRLAFAGAAGGWFAYPAWFPRQDELEASAGL